MLFFTRKNNKELIELANYKHMYECKHGFVAVHVYTHTTHSIKMRNIALNSIECLCI